MAACRSPPSPWKTTIPFGNCINLLENTSSSPGFSVPETTIAPVSRGPTGAATIVAAQAGAADNRLTTTITKRLIAIAGPGDADSQARLYLSSGVQPTARREI